MSGKLTPSKGLPMSETIVRFLRSFGELLYPRLCLLCGEDLTEHQHFICRHCYSELPRTKFEAIKGNIIEQIFWGKVHIEKAASYLFFRKDEKVQKILHQIKYKGNQELGREMGRAMADLFTQSNFCTDIDLIMAVPLHSKKLKQRGYNQSEAIAEGFAERSLIPLLPYGLHRAMYTETQTHKGRYERYKNVDGLFYVSNKAELHGKSILLIDDVITTGSTIEACAKALLEVEGVKVSVATLAYAQLG